MMHVMPAKVAAAEIARQMAAPPIARGRIVFPFLAGMTFCCMNTCISLCGGVYCVDACVAQKSIADDPAVAAEGSKSERDPWSPKPATMQPPTIFSMVCYISIKNDSDDNIGGAAVVIVQIALF